MKILYFLLSTCVLLTVQLSYPQDLRKATSDTGYGERLIRQVSAANKVVIFFDYGVAKAPIGGFLKLISVDSNVLDKASEWKGSAPLPRPVEELINIARSGIEKDRPLSEFKINCCHCNPAKKFATITFGSRKRNQQPSEGVCRRSDVLSHWRNNAMKRFPGRIPLVNTFGKASLHPVDGTPI